MVADHGPVARLHRDAQVVESEGVARHGRTLTASSFRCKLHARVDKEALSFRGGTAGALAPFALFLAGVGWLGIAGAPDERGFWPVLLAALVLGLLLAKDRTEWSEAVLRGMSQPVVALMIVAWLFAGCLGTLLSAQRPRGGARLARPRGRGRGLGLRRRRLSDRLRPQHRPRARAWAPSCSAARCSIPAGAALGANPALLMGAHPRGRDVRRQPVAHLRHHDRFGHDPGRRHPGRRARPAQVRAARGRRRRSWSTRSWAAASLGGAAPSRPSAAGSPRALVMAAGPRLRGLPPPAPAPPRGVASPRDPGHGACWASSSACSGLGSSSSSTRHATRRAACSWTASSAASACPSSPCCSWASSRPSRPRALLDRLVERTRGLARSPRRAEWLIVGVLSAAVLLTTHSVVAILDRGALRPRDRRAPRPHRLPPRQPPRPHRLHLAVPAALLHPHHPRRQHDRGGRGRWACRGSRPSPWASTTPTPGPSWSWSSSPSSPASVAEAAVS